MKKIIIGLGLGTLAGFIDLLPMAIQSLPFNACLSAFSMWIVIGFLISVTEIHIHAVPRAILISLLVLLPNTFIIGWEEPVKLVPIFILTLIIGGLLGYFFDRFTKSPL